MNTTDLDELARELTEVRDWRDELIVRLTQAMTELKETGQAPPADLLHSIREYRRRFESFAEELRAVPELRHESPLAGLDAWDQAIRQVGRRRRLTAFFQEVRRLEYRGDDPNQLMQRIIADADKLRQADDRTSDELIAGRHPLAALLGLVRGGDNLADEEWTALQDRVAEHYGRDLSTAVARGRLRFAERADGSDSALEVMR